MSAWIAVVVAGAGSYLLRAGPLFALARADLPPALRAGLHHAGTAALGALIATSVTKHGGVATTVAGSTAVAAAAVVASRRGRSVVIPVVVGMAVYGVVRAATGLAGI
jgi:branched-subunit amino acid transport protein